MTSTYHLTTLGCAKNQVDSDKLEGMLAAAGYERTGSAAEADLVMVNTCAFIAEARAESVEVILARGAEARPGARLVVLGCLAQRYGSELVAAIPEADLVLGIDRYGELVPTLEGWSGRQSVSIRRRPQRDILHQRARPAPTLPYAYVKVAEGCDKPCTFCAIPLIRGKQRSRPPGEIVAEVRYLVAAGVSEVVLVAQDLASYGRDLGRPGPDLVTLVRQVSEVEGLRWVRLLYLYPREITPALIDEMAGNEKVVDYFDLSLQHSVPSLLRRMKRPGGEEAYLGLIDRIRAAAPEAALRSSFIVGFPGETDDDVERLASFLTSARLDWAGFFPYSPEEGTPAAALEGGPPAETTAERARYLSGIQEEVTAAANLGQVGRRLRLVVDQVDDGIPVGRTYRQAPEIDGLVTVDRGKPGEWLEVEVTASFGSDLEARVAG